MSIVRMNELQTPESVAMKYICRRLGLNLRPDKATYDEESKKWTVPIKAFVPSKVSRRETSKTFVYTFNVGSLVLDKDLRILERMGAEELDDSILAQWNDLNEVIQREILTYAKENWGKLTFVRTFLRPIYTWVVAFLDRGRIDTSLVADEQRKWLRLLRDGEFIEPIEEEAFKTSNKLMRLHEEYFKSGLARSDFDIADVVAGHLFATEYQRLKEEFRVHAPSVYVDTVKLYYVDAINFKEIIPIRENELFIKYRQMGNRVAYREIIERGFSFGTALSELISVGLLHRREENILGDEKLFNHLAQFRDQITPSSEIISE